MGTVVNEYAAELSDVSRGIPLSSGIFVTGQSMPLYNALTLATFCLQGSRISAYPSDLSQSS